MNIESITKFFAPKGMHISDSGRATASEQLTVTDVMAALGMTQAEAGIGLSMFLGKAGISEHDRKASVSWLAEYAKSKAPREGANKQVISSQADSLIKISRIWADFFPANTSNQPI